MKIKFRNILLAITLTVFSALLGVGYCNFLASKNIDTYLGLPIYISLDSKMYDTSTIDGAIKYSDYAFIAKVNSIKTTEYKYEDKKEGLSIDFLLGYKDESWRLWIGKIGSASYDDDPYCDFETKKFSEAIVAALDKVEEFLKKVKDEPDNYVQFYVNL